MGQFDQFINNNNNNNVIPFENALRNQPYLTNAERNRLLANYKRNGNNATSWKKMFNMGQAKLKGKNISQVIFTPLQLGFFNAIVNGDYDKTQRVKLENVFSKKPHDRKPLPGTNLDIEVTSIKLYYGRFKVGAERTKTGVFGKYNSTTNYFMAQIAANIYDQNTRQGITFRVYKNGKIHFSGGFMNNDITHAAKIQKYIVDNFTNREKFLYNSIVYNNTTGQFKINGRFDLATVARAFSKSGKVDYEPELRAALRMEYKGRAFQLFTPGVVQIMGIKSNADMLASYEVGKSLCKELFVMNAIKILTNNVATKVVKRGLAKVVNTNKNAANVKYNASKKRILISKKACMSYDKPQLMSLAKKIGVVNIKSTTKKADICEMIKKRVYGDYDVNGHPCRSYNKDYLSSLAMTKGISVTDEDTVETLCKKLKMPPPKPKKRAPTKKVAAPKEITANNLKKRRLNNKSVKEDIEKLYGKAWLKKYKNVMTPINKNVQEMQKVINALNLKKNKKGIPFKKGVNEVKKSTVRQWKMDRKFELNRKLDKLNDDLAKNLENLLNIEVVPLKRKNNKRFPKGTKVEQI